MGKVVVFLHGEAIPVEITDTQNLIVGYTDSGNPVVFRGDGTVKALLGGFFIAAEENE